MTPHTNIGVTEGYRLWAGCYDDADNALLALEMRTLSGRVGNVNGRRILDAGRVPGAG